MSYLVRRSVGVEQSIERLAATDRDGARLVKAAILALAENPRPAGVHVLNEAERLHRIHLSRLDPNTARTLQYRVMYQIQDRDLIVIVITAAALPVPSRGARAEPEQMTEDDFDQAVQDAADLALCRELLSRMEPIDLERADARHAEIVAFLEGI